jgi:raffinose/stachyose/melibiose transport system permease protein
MRTSRSTGWFLVLPAFLLFATLILWPTVKTAYLSLFQWPGFGGMKFVGLQNYSTAVFEDIYLLGALKNNFIYLALTMLFEVGFGLFLAVMVDQKIKFANLFRSLFFAPMMLSMVVVGLLWSFIFDGDYGLLNEMLRLLGLNSCTRAWMSEPDFALLGICITSGWKYAGFFMIMFYAGLQRIPPQLVESARLDGANDWQILRKIKLPLLREVFIVSFLLCATGAFKLFDLVYVLTSGGPYHKTEVISTWLVRNAFDRFNMGYGSAIAVILTVFVFAVTFIYLSITRKKNPVEY